MKILLLYNEKETVFGGFKALPEKVEIPVVVFPIEPSEEMRKIQETQFFSFFSKPSAGDELPPANPTHVVIFSALEPGWIDFLAGFSCGCHIPLLVYGKDAVNCVPEVFHFCFNFFDSESELQEHLTAEYMADKNIISQRGSNTARKTLLDMGIPVNDKSMADCVNEGQIKEVSLFMEAGFSPDTKDKNGVPLLCLAARNGDLEILKLLLSSGAQVDQLAEDRGSTAIFDASLGKHKDIVMALIEAGADANIQSKDKQTALIVAAGAGDDEIVEVLFRAGADPDIKDCLGASARNYATLFGRSKMVALFNDPSATPPPKTN